jgi:hypothetical protein
MQRSGRTWQARRLAALAAALLLLSSAAAEAGVLVTATLQVGIWPGQPAAAVNFSCDTSSSSQCLTGSTAQSAYLYSGDFFAATNATTRTGVPVVSTLRVRVGSNGALFATPNSVQITAPITGSVVAGRPNYTLLRIPLALGNKGTVTRTGFGGLLRVSVIGSGWHVGSVRTTGTFTQSGVVLPTHTFATTGSFNLLGGGYTYGTGSGTVKLVTLAHVVTTGLYQSNTVAPSSLQLYYAGEGVTTPPPPPPFDMMEPGALLLLTAAGAGLAGFGKGRKGS